jgi:type I restriction enzyme, S subunit
VKDWPKLKLGDVVSLEYGRPLDQSDRCESGAYSVFGANGEIAKSNKFLVDQPTIIVGRKGSAGELKLTCDKSWPLDVTYFVTFERRSFDLKFLYYLLQNQDLTKLAKGVKPGINRNDVYAIEVSVPPLPEQRRIVAILDEAFEGLAIATANTEKNLKNAREVFDVHLDAVVTRRGDDWFEGPLEEIVGTVYTGPFGSLLHKSDYVIDGTPLINPAHIVDGRIIPESHKTVDELTVKRLSSYVLHSGDIVFGRRGDMGRCAVVTKAEAGWICGTGSFFIRLNDKNHPDFLAHLLRSKHYRTKMEAQSAGATMLNLSNAALSNLRIYVPSFEAQISALGQIDLLQSEIEKVEAVYTKKLAAIAELKQSLLHKAFAGELTKDFGARVAVTTPQQVTSKLLTTNHHAGLLAMAYDRHRARDRQNTFGRVKGQKFLQLVESIGKLELGRAPAKDAAGPNDFPHMLRAGEWAKQQSFFEFVKRASGKGFDFKPLAKFDQHLKSAATELAPYKSQIKTVIDLILDMDSEDAELFATVHAAWNNLIIDKKPISDDAIIRAAREDWHADKLKIPEQRFRDALNSIRTRNLEPDGTAKYVGQPRLI